MTVMPCPCCGGEEAREYTYPSSGLVLCGSCGMVVRGGSTPDAIRAWNRLAMAVQIAEAAWLEREAEHAGYTTAVHGQRARQLESCARLEKRRLLDAWGEDGPE